MIIRRETARDVGAIETVTAAAFRDHPISRQTEHFIIRELRAAGALAVSLVAEEGGDIVGHIAFSPVTLTDGSEGWYGLGPISVVPDRQRQGIGTKLMQEGLEALKTLEAQGCVLVGDPHFYERFGFKSPAGLSHEGVPPENLLVLAFEGRVPAGEVEFHKAFGATR